MSLSISRDTLTFVDRKRGAENRSLFIENMLEAAAEEAPRSRAQVRRQGAVYTPSSLATFVAQKLVAYWHADQTANGHELKANSLRVLDPACGDAELLCAAWLQLQAAGVQCVNPGEALNGVDLDSAAVHQARARIGALSKRRSKSKMSSQIVAANALFPFDRLTADQGWKRLQARFGAPAGFDLVIANPPWGADVSAYRENLARGEFRLFQGQFDTSDLFLELALRITRPGGYFAFIVPDSLFSQERAALREMLVQRTQIRFLARLGEKIFDNINRACAVIICRNSPPEPGTLVDCLRLTPEHRARILAGGLTFAESAKDLGHRVEQARFAANAGFAFDIDVRRAEQGILSRCFRSGSRFADYLTSSRGVELSKHGQVCQCPACQKWLPFPTAERPRCLHCKTPLPGNLEAVSITSDEPLAGSQPLIVGESIGRYTLRQFLWIAPHYDGINYKSAAIYESPKLLVRKTGVGVSAAIDYSNAFTNQVVYSFRPRSAAADPCPPLEFFLSVLSSRAMHYLLAKQHGETEWRSHPYLTQKQVLDLPLPAAAVLQNQRREIQELATALQPFTKASTEPSPAVDAQAERLIAQLYGLSRQDYEQIYGLLDAVQQLLPIRALKRISLSQIFGE